MLWAADRALADVELLAVGGGPGCCSALRIGVATARALAQARSIPLVGVSTLQGLAGAAVAEDQPDRPVLAVLDARRGEAFVAAYAGCGVVLEPAALVPEALAEAVADLRARGHEPLLAVGEGALRFRAEFEAAGVAVPADASPLHRVSGRQLCRLAAGKPTAERHSVLPHYLRPPDAKPTHPHQDPRPPR